MLTLLDQQPRDGTRATAAQTALTHHTGQPGALDARTADHWAGPTATLYTDLNSMTPILNRPTLPALPFQSRYGTCFPAKHLAGIDPSAETARDRPNATAMLDGGSLRR